MGLQNWGVYLEDDEVNIAAAFQKFSSSCSQALQHCSTREDQQHAAAARGQHYCRGRGSETRPLRPSPPPALQTSQTQGTSDWTFIKWWTKVYLWALRRVKVYLCSVKYKRWPQSEPPQYNWDRKCSTVGSTLGSTPRRGGALSPQSDNQFVGFSQDKSRWSRNILHIKRNSWNFKCVLAHPQGSLTG